MGANACDVRWLDPLSGKIVVKNLHSIWDDEMVDVLKAEFNQAKEEGKAKGYFGYPVVLEQIEKEYPLTDAKKASLEGGNAREWAAESRSLRQQEWGPGKLTVYPDAPGWKGGPKDRPYCFRYPFPPVYPQKLNPGKMTDDQLPLITEDYIKQFLPVIKQQVQKGGLRLAKMLDDVSEDYKEATTRRKIRIRCWASSSRAIRQRGL